MGEGREEGAEDTQGEGWAACGVPLTLNPKHETQRRKGGGGKGGKGRGKTPKGKTGAHAGIPKTAMTMIKNEADRLEGREAAVTRNPKILNPESARV